MVKIHINKYPIINVSGLRHVYTPICTKKPNAWIELNGVYAHYKESGFSRRYFSNDGLPEDILEKLACKIGRILGLDCANTQLAIKDGAYGCLSYNFVNANEEFIEGGKITNENIKPKGSTYQNLINSVFSGFEKIKLSGNAELKLEKTCIQELKKQFLQMVLFDCMLFNKDRNFKNWGVILNKDTSEIRFAPLFDHDLILLKQHCEYYNTIFRGIDYSRLADYIAKNYYMQTIELVKKIQERITEASIMDILNRFDDKRKFDKGFIVDCIMEGRSMILNRYCRINRFITTLENNICRITKGRPIKI